MPWTDKPHRGHRIWNSGVAGGTGTSPWLLVGVGLGGLLLHGKTPLICYMEANLAFILLRKQDRLSQSLVKLSVLCS